MKNNSQLKNSAVVPVMEPLEPRLLFSADPLSASIGAVLIPEPSSENPDLHHILSSIEEGSDNFPIKPDLDSAADSIDAGSAGTELVFVGSNVKDVKALVDAIEQSTDAEHVEIYTIDEGVNGVVFIDEVLKTYSSVSSVHILTHGSTAGLQLGDVWLSADNLASHASDIQKWQSSLSDEADILFYGCNLAATDSGQQFLNDFGLFTGADVMASEDATGHEDYDGNWELEYHQGTIQTKTLFAESGAGDWEAVLVGILVDTTDDNVDGDADLSSLANLDLNPGSDNAVSLREAIIAANADAAADSITLLPGTYVLASGDMDITNPVSITGDSASNTILDAGDNSRIFDIKNLTGVVQISNLTLMNGSENGAGGAIAIDQAEVVINDSIFDDNESTNNDGGAIQAGPGSTLTISNSVFSQNTAVKDGGAIYSEGVLTLDTVDFLDNSGDRGGAVNHKSLELFTVVDSYFYDNQAVKDGGAIFSEKQITVSGSLFESNDADDDGGAIHAEEAFSIVNSTFYGNTADDLGGAIHTIGSVGPYSVDSVTFVLNEGFGGAVYHEGGAEFRITNSLFEGNVGPGNHSSIGGVITSGGFNLFDSGVHPIDATTAPTDILGVSANVGALEDNGGPQKTVSLNSGSPAINSGGSMTIDATGVVRNEIADIGSYEFSGAAPQAKIYWTDQSTNSIFRSNLDGSMVQEIYSDPGVNFLHDIEVDFINGYIYWTEGEVEYSSLTGQYGRLMQARLDGSDPVELLAGLDAPGGLAIDTANGFVYFTEDATSFNSGGSGGQETVTRYELSTGITTELVTFATGNGMSFKDIEYDASSNSLYWADPGFTDAERRIFRINLDTLAVQNLTPESGFRPYGLTVGLNDNLYWATSTGISSFMPATGTQNHHIDVTSEEILGVQYYEGGIYYTTYAGEIIKTNPALNSFSTIVTGLNDPTGIAIGLPTATDGGPQLVVNVAGTVIEGGQLPLTNTLLNVSDSDTSSDNIVFTVQSQLPSGGEFRDQSNTPVTQFTQQDIDLSNIYFQHDGSENGPYVFSIDITDGNQTLVDVTFTINVTLVNEPPVGTSKTMTVAEGGQIDLVAGDFGFTDPLDPGAGHALQSVTIVTAPVNGTLWLGAQIPANVVTDAQVVSAAQLSQLTYRPSGDDNGNGYATIGFRVTDDGGGADTDTTTRELTINVTPVNDAPVGTSKTMTVAEGGQIDLVAGDFGFTDPLDPGAGHALQSVIIDNAPVNGTLWLGDQIPANIVTDGQVVSAAQLSQLTYRPSGDDNGNGYATIGFRVTDDGGGTDTDTVTRILTLDVTPVDDAPVGTSKLMNVPEDGQLQFFQGDFGFTDPLDPGAGHILQSVTIVSAPVSGTLWLGDQTPTNIVTDGQVIDAAQLSQLTYRPVADESGAAYDAIGFRVTDSGDAISPAANTDVTTRQITLVVSAVNDAPVISDAMLAAIDEDSLNPPGETLQNLFGTTFSDADAGQVLAGVAVVGSGADTGEGVWQYSVDGLNWQSIEDVSQSEALVLDSATSIRFLPTEDFSGIPGDLQVMALDSGFAGEFTNAGNTVLLDAVIAIPDGNISPVAVTLSTEIVAVDDSPEEIVLSNTTVEENVTAAVVGSLSVVDIDDSSLYTFAVDDPRFVVVDDELRLAEGVSLDFEAEPEITLGVQVTDGSGAV
ncbi:MAG: DUF4347 domain-containing protein, partial [Granulosicoccus sp.]|nr:DUF4347 domain-containing protein [Granulosicoccus sp.]